jgi:hypothetical protein
MSVLNILFFACLNKCHLYLISLFFSQQQITFDQNGNTKEDFEE